VAKKKGPWQFWLESLDKAARDATGEGLVSIVGKLLSDLTSVPPPPSAAQQAEMAKAKEVKKRLNRSKMEAARSSRTIHPVLIGWTRTRWIPDGPTPGQAFRYLSEALRGGFAAACLFCCPPTPALARHSPLISGHPPASKISLALSRS